MFKKTMKFDNLDGEEVEDTFYFNFSKKEIAELLQFGQILKFADPDITLDGLEVMMEKLSMTPAESGLTEQQNTRQAYEILQRLLLDAYGEKGQDNVTFVKNERTRAFWESHVAFVELIFEMIENPSLGASFIESCLPPRMVNDAKKDMAKNGAIPAATLSEMVAEAERRQADPATRIEPGPEAAAAALGENAEMAKLAGEIKQQIDPTAAKKQEDLTNEEILSMPQDEFDKLDPRRFSHEQLLIAMSRKNRSS